MQIPWVDGVTLEDVIIAVKSADQSVTSDTTVNDDTDITMHVVEDALYMLEGCLYFTASADGPGVKFDFEVTNGGPADQSAVHCHGVDTAGTVIALSLAWAAGTADCDNYNTSALDDSLNPVVNISGIVFAPSAGNGLLRLRWAQQASTATALVLKKGSWVRITRIR